VSQLSLAITVVLFGKEFNMNAWKIRNNAETFGVRFAAENAAKHGVNISIVLYVLFGRY
jgi:hypothetical protein